MRTVPLKVHTQTQTVPLKVGVRTIKIVNTDYDVLEHKPSINGVELDGDKTSAQLGIDQTYVHDQMTASDTWTINHNMGKYPSVSVVDSAGTVCEGAVTYIDNNTVVCHFNGAFSGFAYLN